ncbi:divergent polysaccharide deacetylase family protein [Candidatus Hydrogenedentota bacterium]
MITSLGKTGELKGEAGVSKLALVAVLTIIIVALGLAAHNIYQKIGASYASANISEEQVDPVPVQTQSMDATSNQVKDVTEPAEKTPEPVKETLEAGPEEPIEMQPAPEIGPPADAEHTEVESSAPEPEPAETPTPEPKNVEPAPQATEPTPVETFKYDPTVLPKDAPKLAIIVDDLGNGMGKTFQRLLTLDIPLTGSILPKLKLSRRTAEALNDKGIEVMLHLPMESLSGPDKSPGALTLNMTEEDISRVLVEDMMTVPFAKGINNHTGSAMTESRANMEVFIECLAELGMYFVDSRTSTKSVAYDVALDYGIMAGHNLHFVDSMYSQKSPREEFMVLLSRTKKNGRGIGVMHPKAGSVNALVELLPEFQRRGIRLVTVSEIVR